jgi:hypothetical protein
MSIQKTINNIHGQLVDSISGIQEFPEGLLPHIVFIEEEGDTGYPVYNRYQLLKVFPDGNCVVKSPDSEDSTPRHLSEINIDWLLTVWNYYTELKHTESKKELSVFLFPLKRFDRNATDEEITSDWENNQEDDLYVEKLTPDEFAARINDDAFNEQEYYVRFIKY